MIHQFCILWLEVVVVVVLPLGLQEVEFPAAGVGILVVGNRCVPENKRKRCLSGHHRHSWICTLIWDAHSMKVF